MALKDELGEIAWYNLMTKNSKLATDYYKSLFGWETKDFEIEGFGKGTIYSAAGRPFAGPMDLGDVPEVESHWIAYFSVEDVDKSCELLKSLSGKVCYEPFDMPTIGRTAVVEDPEGNVFHLFTPEDKSSDVNIMGGEFGQACWLELTSDKPKELSEFYGKLLAWDIEVQDMGAGPYYMGQSGDHLVAGIANSNGAPNLISSWLPFFMVTDISESSEKSLTAGGECVLETQFVAGVGHFALHRDPSGACFYLFQGDS